jgi:hypothetical protein
LALTSPTSGGCSVGIVRLRTTTKEFLVIIIIIVIVFIIIIIIDYVFLINADDPSDKEVGR